MINAIVFSKDRAQQLRLLLESINKNAPGIFELSVIYHSGSENFDEGYQKLISEDIIDNITWIKQGEDNFKETVLNLFKDTKCDYSCFFTDDDIIYRPVDVSEITTSIESEPEIFCFSLRLGKNVTWCYTVNCNNVLHDPEETDNTIKWDWQKHYVDFGYPLSVDGHIFRTKDIFKLVRKVPFNNPNEMEAGLQMFDNFPKNKMAAFKESALVNTPINIVQNTFPNREGEEHGVTVESLNESYLEGKVIDLDSIDFSKIIGCHQELELPLVEYSPLKSIK